jgi:hypothetical protein
MQIDKECPISFDLLFINVFVFCRIQRWADIEYIYIWRVISKLSFKRNCSKFAWILRKCYISNNIEKILSQSLFTFLYQVKKIVAIRRSIPISNTHARKRPFMAENGVCIRCRCAEKNGRKRISFTEIL